MPKAPKTIKYIGMFGCIVHCFLYSNPKKVNILNQSDTKFSETYSSLILQNYNIEHKNFPYHSFTRLSKDEKSTDTHAVCCKIKKASSSEFAI